MLTRNTVSTAVHKPLRSPTVLSFFLTPISTLLTNPSENPPPNFHFSGTPSSTSFGRQILNLYSFLFSKLRSPPHVFEAKKLQALLVVNGFFNSDCSDRVLGSQLVNVYVSLGCLLDALVVFDKLPQKSNIAWNAILRGLVDGGQVSKAIELFRFMVTQGVIPDNFTYPLVLRACALSNDLEEGRRVLDLITRNEDHQDRKCNIYVDCAMIDMFSKCGSLSEAQRVFEGIPKKDLACWSAMIGGTIQSGEWSAALSLFKRMRLEGLRPDAIIMATILPACGRLEAKQVGMALQGCAISSGFESDLHVSNALMDMYCKCGDTHHGYSIFCFMESRDVVSWSTLIAGYGQNCQYHESVQLYLRMRSADIRTNAITAASVLPGFAKLKLLRPGKEMHNYILRQGFESDIVVGSALIDMYANFGSMREAGHVFRIMADMDIIIWNSMIVGYSLNGDVESTFRIFRGIWDSNFRPNSITLLSILPTCTRMGNLRYGKEIHGYATRSSLGSTVPIGNSILDLYCKCGYLELGVRFFKNITAKNIVTYNTIISAHGVYGLGNHVFSLFEQMKEAGIRPNKVTFIALLTACSHAGLVDRGRLLYKSMIYDYNIPPEMEHYSCIVDLLGRAGHLDDAYDLIRRMPVEPDINLLGSLLGACRIHNKIELAELIGKQILEKKQKDSGHYILLSHVYASIGRWNDALKVRTIIKQKGLSKKPGISWVQIGSSIHMFLARHWESDKIREVLDSLLVVMRDEGYTPDPSFFSDDLVCDVNELIDFDVGRIPQ